MIAEELAERLNQVVAPFADGKYHRRLADRWAEIEEAVNTSLFLVGCNLCLENKSYVVPCDKAGEYLYAMMTPWPLKLISDVAYNEKQRWVKAGRIHGLRFEVDEHYAGVDVRHLCDTAKLLSTKLEIIDAQTRRIEMLDEIERSNVQLLGLEMRRSSLVAKINQDPPKESEVEQSTSQAVSK